MPYTRAYLYSPLTTEQVSTLSGRSLLMQFILSELFTALDQDEIELENRGGFFPYDWSSEISVLKKLKEHAQLLLVAFPDQKNLPLFFDALTEIKKGEIPLKKGLLKLYQLIVPYVHSVKEDPSFLLFLVKKSGLSKKALGLNGTLINELFPEGALSLPTKGVSENLLEQLKPLLKT